MAALAAKGSMQILATGTSAIDHRLAIQALPNRERARGFTLIEILVAVVIIGIVMSVAVLSLSLAGDDRELRKEARRLMSLIELAQNDSMLQGREFGVEFMSSSYRFVEYDAELGQWAEPFYDDSLRLWQLPEDIEFDLIIEDKRILLDEQAQVIDYEETSGIPRETYAPHLLIFSSGDSTPFELHLRVNGRRDDLSVVVEGDLLGNLEIVNEDDRDL